MKLSAPIFRLRRRAKLLARDRNIPLHAALDATARAEGFRNWNHLSAAMAERGPARALLSRLDPGDFVLLGARPGHGKTLLGIGLAVEAARLGRPGYFFTLDYHAGDVLRALRALGIDPATIGGPFVVDTSDDICADHVVATLGAATDGVPEGVPEGGPVGAVAVIDYLQLLDQRRRNPGIDDQVRALRAFAGASGAILVAISQIDRAFEGRADRRPTLSDVRQPNPFDLTLFTKACFLHEGELRLDLVA